MPLETGSRVSESCCVGLDASVDVIAWNEAAQRLFGYSEPEVLGKNIYHLLNLRGIADGRFESALASAYHDGKVEIDSCFNRKDGTNFHACCVVKPAWHQATFRGYVVTMYPRTPDGSTY
jgi:PAS domain S-box-containing protein